MKPFAALCLLLLGCSSSNESQHGVDLARVSDPLIVARPYQSHVPSSYDPKTPAPLVVLLHGFMITGFAQDLYFGLTATSDEKGFLYAYPDGIANKNGMPFWNATNACCDFYGEGVDDVAYLTAVIDDMSARYNVDPKRVYFIGHSNGGFMSYRMACDAGSRLAGIVVLAGQMWLDTTKCPGASPVPVLHVHGNADTTILYNGEPGTYPSATQSVADWAALDGCGPLMQTTETLDLVTGADAETTVARHTGCPNGLRAELWTIKGGPHAPSFNQPGWGDQITSWLFKYARP